MLTIGLSHTSETMSPTNALAPLPRDRGCECKFPQMTDNSHGRRL